MLKFIPSLFLALCITVSLQAQTTYSVELGGHGSYHSFSGDSFSNPYKLGAYGAVGVSHQLSEKWLGRMDLNLVQRGPLAAPLGTYDNTIYLALQTRAAYVVSPAWVVEAGPQISYRMTRWLAGPGVFRTLRWGTSVGARWTLDRYYLRATYTHDSHGIFQEEIVEQSPQKQQFIYGLQVGIGYTFR